MKLYLKNIPEWVIEESQFLTSYVEDFENPYIEIYLFNENIDINNKTICLFEKDKKYINMDFFLQNFDFSFTFFDFLCFQKNLSEYILPKIYDTSFLSNNQKNLLKKHLFGIQLHYFDLLPIPVYSKNKPLNKELRITLENSHIYKDWIIHYFNDYKIRPYLDKIQPDGYCTEFNISTILRETLFETLNLENMTLEVFDYLYSINHNTLIYQCVRENLIIYRKKEIIEKYITHFQHESYYNHLLTIAFQKNGNENEFTHLQFVQFLLENGFLFHYNFNYFDNAYTSNNLLLINYIYEKYKDDSKSYSNIIYSVLYKLSLKKNPICTNSNKYLYYEFIHQNHLNLVSSNQFIEKIYSSVVKTAYKNSDFYDFDFIDYIIQKSNNIYNYYTLIIHILLKREDKINEFINMCLLKMNDIVFLKNALKNTMKYIIQYENIEYVSIYLTNKFYIYDVDKEYLSYSLENYEIYKLLYDSGMDKYMNYPISSRYGIIFYMINYGNIEKYETYLKIAFHMYQNGFVPNEDIKDKLDLKISENNNQLNIIQRNKETSFPEMFEKLNYKIDFFKKLKIILFNE